MCRKCWTTLTFLMFEMAGERFLLMKGFTSVTIDGI